MIVTDAGIGGPAAQRVGGQMEVHAGGGIRIDTTGPRFHPSTTAPQGVATIP